MNILKIIHGYPPKYNAGSEVYSQSICNELINQGHHVTVLTREEMPYRADFEFRHYREQELLQFYYINMPRDKDGYRHNEIDEQFANLLKKERPDIAHVGHLNHLSTGLIQQLKKAGIPIIFTLHDFWLMCPRGQFLQRNYDGCNTYQLCSGQENRKCATSCYQMFFSGLADFYEQDVSYWTSWIARRMNEINELVSMVDRFIAPSRYLMNRFIKDFHLPKEQVIYLDYGFPTHYLQPITKSKKEDLFTFGYIGTHIPAKGVNLLIEAFRKIEGKAKLKIWGWKDSQSQKALLEMTKSSDNPIEFCGGYINENLADVVFSQIDAIVVPSIWGENSPLVIHEAQACHIPVITADYGGMAEYVQHHTNGLLFKHRDVQSITEQLQWALNHSSQMENLGKKGYLYSENGQVPTIKYHCSQLEVLYQNMISNYG
ncbi:MAG: glycosyltransferase [Aureispira sp.]